ncbi:FUSC family protein [Solitalea lacus]|uniref:FUSC family protein n=1 Tax=Solitalea lacus TaxID=2911172 RepID=UPI001EDC7129|nr:FUSC family protein [Solitalea lacus]UKJ08669.1 FUSC family protein [Solitalea lacus]
MLLKTYISNPRTFIQREQQNPDITRALISMISLVSFLIVAERIGYIHLAVFGGLAAELISWARVTGSFAQRLWVIILGSLAVSIAAFLGTIAGGNMATAMAFLLIVAFLSGMARGLGDHGLTLGTLAVVLFLLSLNGPNTIESALHRAFAVSLGGLLAIILRVLILWFLKPMLPYDVAISKPWTVGAGMMGMIPNLATIDEREAESRLNDEEVNLRLAINGLLPYLRKGDSKLVSVRRELLKVVRAGSRFGSTAMALFYEMNEINKHERLRFILPTLNNTFQSLELAGSTVSHYLLSRSAEDEELLKIRIQRVENMIVIIRKRLDAAGLPLYDKVEVLKVINMFELSVRYLHTALSWAERIDEKRKQLSFITHFQPAISIRTQWRNTISEFTADSELFRHSLRLAVIAVLGIFLFYFFDIPRGYWISLTIMVVLQPDYSSTRLKAWDRLLGTLGGVMVGSLIIHFVQFHYIVFIIIAICLFLYLYFVSRNYALAVFFLTIELVALIDLTLPYDWHIGFYRVMNTVLGGVIAVASAYLLWPKWEHIRLNQYLAKALIANKAYLLQVGHEFKEKTGFHARLIALRRKAEVANLNMAEALKRIKYEPGASKVNLKLGEELAYYNAKLTREITSFGAILPGIRKQFEYPITFSLIEESGSLLNDLAEAIEQDQLICVRHTFTRFFLEIEQKVVRVKESNPENDPKKQKEIEYQLTDLDLIRSQLEKITTEIAAMCNISGKIELQAIETHAVV